MSTRQIDTFIQGWERALRGVQICLVASFHAPDVRPHIEIALEGLIDALAAAQLVACANLETCGFHDLVPPAPPSVLSPAIRGALVRRIEAVATAPTRRELKERLAEEGASAVGLIGVNGVTPRFIAHALAHAAGDCALISEPPAVRKLRRVPLLTAKLIVLGALERASHSALDARP